MTTGQPVRALASVLRPGDVIVEPGSQSGQKMTIAGTRTTTLGVHVFGQNESGGVCAYLFGPSDLVEAVHVAAVNL